MNSGKTLHKAQKLGEGVITTGMELSQAISPAGDEMYFARMAEQGDWNIYYSKWNKGQWTDPVVAPFSSPYTDADPYFTSNGKKIFFLSDRPIKEGGEPFQFPDVWYVEKTTDGWSAPVYAKELNTAFGEGFMSLTNEGDIVFSSNQGNGDSFSIFKASHNGTTFETPQPIALPIKVKDYANPLIARDGSYLIIDSDMKEGEGADDLYILFKEGNSWTEPVNLGPTVNSPDSEGAPYVTFDGEHLLFGRIKVINDQFSSDIYQVSFQPLLKKAKQKAGLK
jgi:Tol biopolymer transport system component